MKNREKTGKAFRIKWLLLALVAAALIFVPAASHKVSAAKLVYTVKFNNNSGTSKSKTYTALTQNVTLNTTIRLPAVPKAVGYQNLGWTTRKGSSKVVYKAGARVKVRKRYDSVCGPQKEQILYRKLLSWKWKHQFRI